MDQSPVDVVIGIRKDLEEFQRRGGKQALRAEMQAACRDALLRTVSDPDADAVIVAYLEQRELLRRPGRPNSRAAVQNDLNG